MGEWWIYICNRNGVLYTGITTNLNHRMAQHKARLLYSEHHNNRDSAVRREKQIKNWSRSKKISLIESGLD